jgi:hypothetical protein
MLTPFLSQKLDDSRQMFGLGSSIDDLVEVLHDQGLSVDEASVVLAGVLDVDAVEARVLVADNVVWVEVVDQDSPVISEVMRVLDREGQIDDLGDGVIVYREQLADERLIPAITPSVTS